MYLLNIIFHQKQYKYTYHQHLFEFQLLAPSLSINKNACCPKNPPKKPTSKFIPTTIFLQKIAATNQQFQPGTWMASTTSGCTPLKSRTRATNCKVLILATNFFFKHFWEQNFLQFLNLNVSRHLGVITNMMILLVVGLHQ